jgi:hypothetical protein
MLSLRALLVQKYKYRRKSLTTGAREMVLTLLLDLRGSASGARADLAYRSRHHHT